jgi:hypothetical protein
MTEYSTNLTLLLNDYYFHTGHADDVLALLRNARSMRERDAAKEVQLVAIGATLDRATRRHLFEAMPGASLVRTETMHRLPVSFFSLDNVTGFFTNLMILFFMIIFVIESPRSFSASLVAVWGERSWGH